MASDRRADDPAGGDRRGHGALVVVRVWLPDRPGALGQVASRIGAVRGDVLGIEILEAGAGRVIDELVVGLDHPGLVQLMLTEVAAVDGVTVEHVRPLAGDRRDPDLAALGLAADLAACAPGEHLPVLAEGLVRSTDADWVRVEVAGLDAVTRGVHAVTADTHTLEAPLPRCGGRVTVGRAERPLHARERERFSLLCRIADPLIAATTALPGQSATQC